MVSSPKLIDFYHPALLRSDARWFEACRQPSTFMKSELASILPALYRLFPQPGMPTHPAIPVIIKNGDEVTSHAHPQWTLVLYIALGSPAIPVLFEDHALLPRRGQVVLIPPYLAHAVPRSNSLAWRLSIALRWKNDR